MSNGKKKFTVQYMRLHPIAGEHQPAGAASAPPLPHVPPRGGPGD